MQTANLLGILLVIVGALISMTGLGVVIGAPMVAFGFLLIILNAVVKGGSSLGASAVSGGQKAVNGEEEQMANTGEGQTLYEGKDLETISRDDDTHYDFEISDYGYKKAKVRLGVKTLNSGEVDVVVVKREDREMMPSFEDIPSLDRLSRYGVEEDLIEGLVDPGEWSVILRNTGEDSVDIEFTYKIEGVTH